MKLGIQDKEVGYAILEYVFRGFKKEEKYATHNEKCI